MLNNESGLEAEVGLEWLNQEKFDKLIDKYKLKKYETPVYLGSVDLVAYSNDRERVYFFERKQVKTRKKEEVFEYKPRFSLDMQHKTFK